jgi:hypothetical protein
MKALKMRRLEAKDRKCYLQAFENNSLVGVRSPIAEPVVMHKKYKVMQWLNTECIQNSVYLETCL